MNVEEQNLIRDICLKNAEDLVTSAKALQGRSVEHVCYHLAVLALEEIGKITLLQTKFAIAEHGDPEAHPKVVTDDHVKKLFWALWGPAFGRDVLTKEQMESYRGLATTIHQNRLDYLYVDPDKPVPPQNKMRAGDAENMINFADAAVQIEKASGRIKFDENRAELIRWLLEATDDPARRGYITGQESMEKMAELGSAPKWVEWLRGYFEQREAEALALTEKELNRDLPTGAEGQEPKWRIKVRIYSESHSIRPAFLAEWNKISKYMLLYAGNRKDEIVCHFVLPKSLSVERLLDAGFEMSLTLVTALNVGATGFFWWHVPKEHHFFYEEMTDLETNKEVRSEVHPLLKIDWGKQALKTDRLSHIRVVMSYMAKVRGTPREAPFGFYQHGLALIAKSDLHIRFETNAFEQFFKAFKSALYTGGDWDGEADLLEAAQRGLGYEGQEIENLTRYIALGIQAENTKAGVPEITLQDVAGMKGFCDLYFLILSMRRFGLEL